MAKKKAQVVISDILALVFTRDDYGSQTELVLTFLGSGRLRLYDDEVRRFVKFVERVKEIIDA